MSELFALADRITILRDGRTVDVGEMQSYDPDLITSMIGAAPAPATAPSSELDERPPALRVRALSVPGPRGQRDGVGRPRRGGRHRGAHRLRPDGAARGDLRERRPSAGHIELAGTEPRHGQIAEAIEHGLAYVPGDRKNQGLVLSMSVTENLMMATTSRKMRLRVPSRSLERAETRDLAATFGIVAASPDVACSTLSGGNQQKVVIAKWMRGSPRVLLMDEPTRGVDVGAKREIYRLLADARAEGVGILVSSSETEELLLLCDRILVMVRGRIVASLDRAQATEANVAHYSMGAA